MSQWDRKGLALLEELTDALFFFGSKRSWVFPASKAERDESRGQNPGYMQDRFQPLRSLIIEKESRGEVFWLKPPGFIYNGSLFHGDPTAFARASDWLQQLTDPTTGERFRPLLLDEQWWRQSFRKADAVHTRDVGLIVKNFTCGAHDYLPVMELLYQSNPTLDIVL